MASLKPLKAVAHNLAHQLGSTLNYWHDDYGIHHLANQAERLGLTEVIINVLDGSTTPPSFRQGIVGEIVDSLRSTLVQLSEKAGVPFDVVASSVLIYTFTGRTGDGLPTYNCVSRITTKTGRTFESHLTEWHNL